MTIASSSAWTLGRSRAGRWSTIDQKAYLGASAVILVYVVLAVILLVRRKHISLPVLTA